MKNDLLVIFFGTLLAFVLSQSPDETYDRYSSDLRPGPFAILGSNIGKALEDSLIQKIVVPRETFPDSGRTRAVLEEKSRESPAIQLDIKYGNLQQKFADLNNYKPVVDTISEHEKYGNDGQKGRDVAKIVIDGFEGFANVLNTLVELPYTGARQFGKKVTTNLNAVGGKLVGLS
ncbi:unnamed protein product [Callosobruchus maculatus]|uniref:Uncharacterized protein n=1 Tax=Callosobruchus maculatus TaxID=64391 RepID=A0A653C1I6_CALMS|nr:unnamed protein product [Callosobruchus maculatus]